jgi:ABC-2 type transport system ATP-binding protein
VIAEGTSDELKSQVGGDRIEIVVDSAQDVSKAAIAIAEFGSAPAITEDLTQTILLPVLLIRACNESVNPSTASRKA